MGKSSDNGGFLGNSKEERQGGGLCLQPVLSSQSHITKGFASSVHGSGRDSFFLSADSLAHFTTSGGGDKTVGGDKIGPTCKIS